MKTGKKEKLLRRVLLIGMLCAVSARYKATQELKEWPQDSDIRQETLTEPQQTETTEEPFIFEYRGREFLVEPVQDYELSGLVVSHNDIHSWFDMYHNSRSVDFKDLCVVWGANVSTGIYKEADYSSAPWTCFYHPKSFEANERFFHSKLSNNHILSDSSSVRDAVMGAGVGDQIHLRGKLINYAPKEHPTNYRKSSLVRTDTGNGACEVLFVDSFAITKAHKPFWRGVDRVSRNIFWLFCILLPITRLLSGVRAHQQQKKALELAIARRKRRKEALAKMGSRYEEIPTGD